MNVIPQIHNKQQRKGDTKLVSPFQEKVFLLLMGCSKNYIMYWDLRVLV